MFELRAELPNVPWEKLLTEVGFWLGCIVLVRLIGTWAFRRFLPEHLKQYSVKFGATVVTVYCVFLVTYQTNSKYWSYILNPNHELFTVEWEKRQFWYADWQLPSTFLLAAYEANNIYDDFHNSLMFWHHFVSVIALLNCMYCRFGLFGNLFFTHVTVASSTSFIFVDFFMTVPPIGKMFPRCKFVLEIVFVFQFFLYRVVLWGYGFYLFNREASHVLQYDYGTVVQLACLYYLTFLQLKFLGQIYGSIKALFSPPKHEDVAASVES